MEPNMPTNTTKVLIEHYVHALLNAETDTLRQCIADEISVDSGTTIIHTADDFTAMCRVMPPLKSWAILDIFTSDSGGAVLYEAVNTHTGDRQRIAEFLTVSNGKITHSRSVYMTFPSLGMVLDD